MGVAPNSIIELETHNLYQCAFGRVIMLSVQKWNEQNQTNQQCWQSIVFIAAEGRKPFTKWFVNTKTESTHFVDGIPPPMSSWYHLHSQKPRQTDWLEPRRGYNVVSPKRKSGIYRKTLYKCVELAAAMCQPPQKIYFLTG